MVWWVPPPIFQATGEMKRTLVFMMLMEMVEYSHKIEEKLKAMLSEIKENVQGTNSDRKETRTQINSLDQKE